MYKLVLLLLIAPLCLAQQNPVIDVYNNINSFSGPRNITPNFELLRDEFNNKVAAAALTGATEHELESLSIPDLQHRLLALTQANLIENRSGKYFLTIPVITGKRRTELAKLVTKQAQLMLPKVAPMVEEIRKAVPGHEDVVFHLLWSRVIDDAWSIAWELEKRGANGTPGVDWVILPRHAYMVGTNYWGNEIAITWSEHTGCGTRAVQDSRLLLRKAAWGQVVRDDRVATVAKYGLLDTGGRFRGFAIHKGDAVDTLVQRLRAQYAHLIANAYDTRELGSRWGVPADKLWVILLHETAYSLFGELANSGHLSIPGVLRGNGNLAECKSAISLWLDKPVTRGDDVRDKFERTGYVGSQEVIQSATEVLASEPGNVDALYYLGLSQYEVKDYRAALSSFQRLLSICEVQDVRCLLGHLWMGHLLDLTNERQKAILEYEYVAGSSAEDAYLNYSGYHIGPTTIKSWAQERIKSPFRREE